MKHIQQLIRLDFVRFCIVGVSGFVINLILLKMLSESLKINIFIAQLISSEISLFSNFIMHNYWTYKHKRVTKTIPMLLWQFHATSWIAILGSALIVGGLVSWLKMDKVIALVIASVIALGWNFVWTKFVIWRHEQEEQTEEIHE